MIKLLQPIALLKLLLSLLLIVVITGCVTVESPATPFPSELRQTSVISTSLADFNPRHGTTVAWRKPIAVQTNDDTSLSEANVEFITQAIEQALVNKGYRVVTYPQTSDYWLNGLIVLGNDLNESELRNVLGFEPGLVARDQKHEKGSLLLLLIDPRNGLTQWRSAVQILTAPELDDSVRRNRVEFAIRNLMRPLPNTAL